MLLMNMEDDTERTHRVVRPKRNKMTPRPIIIKFER